MSADPSPERAPLNAATVRVAGEAQGAPIAEETVAARPNRPFAAMAWMVFACLLFAVMSLFAKRAMAELSFLEVASGRALFGAVTIWAFARARGASLVVHDRKTQWSRTGAGILAMFCSFYALSQLPLGDAVTLANLTPLFLAVASRRVLGERAGSGLVVAVLLGLAGVALLAGAHFGPSRGGASALVAAVAGAAFSCVAMLFLRRLGARESAEGVSLHFQIWGAITTFVAGLPWFRVPGPMAFASLVLAGLMGGLAQVVMTKAYGLDKAARVGAAGYSGVVISMLLGVLFLHEIPGVSQLAGAALVVVSGLVLLFGAVRER